MEDKGKMENTKEIHKAIQRSDGSIYCYCDELEGTHIAGKVACSVNFLKKKVICTVCGKEVDSKSVK